MALMKINAIYIYLRSAFLNNSNETDTFIRENRKEHENAIFIFKR